MTQDMQQPRPCPFCGHVYPWITVNAENQVVVFRFCPKCNDKVDFGKEGMSKREQIAVGIVILGIVFIGTVGFTTALLQWYFQ